MSKTADTLNNCHFSVKILNQTLLFTALPYANLKVLGKSCHIETTTRGFILYPRTECAKDTIAIESCYYGQQGKMHHECFIIKTGWNDAIPKITEITDTCTDKKQLLIANGHLTIRMADLTYTTSQVPPKEEARFHVSYDTLCKYEAEIINAVELQRIAQKIKDGQKQEEAETIESLKERIGYLNSELSETRNSLDSSRNNLKSQSGELNNLRKQLAKTQEKLREKEAEIRELNSQVSALTKTGQKLVNEVVDWGNRNLTALFRVLMPEEVDGALKKMKVALKNNTSIHDGSAEFLSDSPENNSFMGDGTGEKSN